MPSLEGLAKEWEEDSVMRENLHKSKMFLQKEAWEETVKVDIKHATMNFHVLKPLVKKLRDSSGEVGMHGIPEIEKQTLRSKSVIVFLIFPIRQVFNPSRKTQIPF